MTKKELLHKIMLELQDEWQMGGLDESTLYGKFAMEVARRYHDRLTTTKKAVKESNSFSSRVDRALAEDKPTLSSEQEKGK